MAPFSCAMNLFDFFPGSISLLIQIQREIGNVDASSALLARFKSSDGQLDLTGQYLALEYERCEVRKVVGAHLLERDDSQAVVLRHQ